MVMVWGEGGGKRLDASCNWREMDGWHGHGRSRPRFFAKRKRNAARDFDRIAYPTSISKWCGCAGSMIGATYRAVVGIEPLSPFCLFLTFFFFFFFFKFFLNFF